MSQEEIMVKLRVRNQSVRATNFTLEDGVMVTFLHGQFSDLSETQAAFLRASHPNTFEEPLSLDIKKVMKRK